MKNLWTDCWIVTVAYLKKQPLEAFCKKRCSKNFANFTGKHQRTCNFLKKRLQHRYFSNEKQVFPVFFQWNFRNSFQKSICEPFFCIFTGNFIYNAWKKGVIRTLSNKYDGVFCETVNGFQALTIVRKNFHHLALCHSSKYTYEPQI